MSMNKSFFLLLGPIVALLSYLILSQIGLDEQAAIAAAITVLTVIWWVTKPIPIPATSLVPFALLPLFGIVDHKRSPLHSAAMSFYC